MDSTDTTPGLIIAAPASGSGKTTMTLGLLRALRNRGVAVGSAKVGPDYIDPGFHRAASGRPSYNLDSWAMREATLASAAQRACENAELAIAEGVMGLFDGAPDGRGSSAELAKLTGWPVILVVDAQGMAASAAAVVHGFLSFDSGVNLAGVIFNRVGSEAHGALLREACASLPVAVLGALPRQEQLELPDRHLGLVPAQEHPELELFLEQAAAAIGEHLDLDMLQSLARPCRLVETAPGCGIPIPPLGQRIAVAHDDAFAFIYPLLVEGWQAAGCEVLPFSPLEDQSPATLADAVYLPGGYPELHAGRIASNRNFLHGLRVAAERGAQLFGECGGYMVLGETLIDADGVPHPMSGLLPLTTTFADRGLTLGYRRLELAADGPLGKRGDVLHGHEFHFSKVVSAATAIPLYTAQDARGQNLGAIGLSVGKVSGSFIHLIDRA